VGASANGGTPKLLPARRSLEASIGVDELACDLLLAARAADRGHGPGPFADRAVLQIGAGHAVARRPEVSMASPDVLLAGPGGPSAGLVTRRSRPADTSFYPTFSGANAAVVRYV
jgi:hypothetical protein